MLYSGFIHGLSTKDEGIIHSYEGTGSSGQEPQRRKPGKGIFSFKNLI